MSMLSPRLLTATLFMLMLAISGCSSIIGATTEKPINPDPTKRTIGTMIDDERLETIAKVNIDKAHPDLKNAHINVIAYNGVILLTGQVGSQQMRNLAADTVSQLPKVRQVFNEIQIQGKTSFLSRTNDAWLTSKVKIKLMGYKDIDSSRVKVVSENGTVFLMGMLSQVQAEKAANVVRTVGGVQRVVKAVEYLD